MLHFFFYLAEASLYLAAFALLYRIGLYSLTQFQWNRAYLVGCLLLSLLLPLLPVPSLLPANSPYAGTLLDFNLAQFGISSTGNGPTMAQATEKSIENTPAFQLPGILLMGLYLVGCLYKIFRFGLNIAALYKLMAQSQMVQQGAYCLVYTHKHAGIFSFLHYIFIPEKGLKLSGEEYAQVLQHEQSHITHRHTLDLLLYEIGAVLLWLHPAIYYLQTCIREVHEYQVDAAVVRSQGNTKAYGALLIKLASQSAPTPLLNTFSSKQILNRITMLTQTKPKPVQKLRFLALLPVAALTILLCSFLGFNTSTPAQAVMASATNASNPFNVPIRKITWFGNKVHTSTELNKVLGLKPGDTYNKADLEKRLGYNPSGNDLSSLYMDNGYLFFAVEPKEIKADKAMDLELYINEGPQMKIGQLSFEGNKKISIAELMAKVNIKTGELFDRSKLIAAQQAIVEMGSFNPGQISINPMPDIEAGTVDIVFRLEEN